MGDPVSRRHQIFSKMIRWCAPVPQFLKRLIPVSRGHQNGSAATGVPGRLNILDTVPHEQGSGQIDVIPGLCLINQSGLRFAAVTPVIRGMRTEKTSKILPPAAAIPWCIFSKIRSRVCTVTIFLPMMD